MKFVGTIGTLLASTLVAPWLYGRQQTSPRVFVLENISESTLVVDTEKDVTGSYSLALQPLFPLTTEIGRDRCEQTCERSNLLWQFLFSLLNTLLCHMLFWIFAQKRRTRREPQNPSSIGNDDAARAAPPARPQTSASEEETRAMGRNNEDADDATPRAPPIGGPVLPAAHVSPEHRPAGEGMGRLLASGEESISTALEVLCRDDSSSISSLKFHRPNSERPVMPSCPAPVPFVPQQPENEADVSSTLTPFGEGAPPAGDGERKEEPEGMEIEVTDLPPTCAPGKPSESGSEKTAAVPPRHNSENEVAPSAGCVEGSKQNPDWVEVEMEVDWPRAGATAKPTGGDGEKQRKAGRTETAEANLPRARTATKLGRSAMRPLARNSSDEDLSASSTFARYGDGALSTGGAIKAGKRDRDEDDCKPPVAKKQKTLENFYQASKSGNQGNSKSSCIDLTIDTQ